MEWRMTRFCAVAMLAALAVFGGIAAAGEKQEYRAWDFVPRGSVFAVQAADPANIAGIIIDRGERAAGAPGMIKNMFVMGMQQLTGGAIGGLEIRDVFDALGIDAKRKGVLGLLPFVDGHWTSLEPPGMVYMVIPVSEPQITEKILRERLLPLIYRSCERRCMRMTSRIRIILSRKGVKPGQKNVEVDLGKAPFTELACPCGGKFELDGRMRLRCEVHANFDRNGIRDALQAGLERTEVGPFDYFGSPELGAAYGIGKGYVVVAPDARVVKACLLAATSKDKRISVQPLSRGFEQGVLQWGPLAEIVRVMNGYSWDTLRHGRPLPQARFLEFLRNQPPLRFHVTEENPNHKKDIGPGESVLVLHAEMKLGQSGWARHLAAARPEKPGLSRYLSPDAPLMIAGNILPEFAEIVADAIAAFGDHEAVIAKLAPLLAGRECAFAMTHSHDGGVGGVPHMEFIFSRDNERVKRVLDMLPEIIAGMARMQPKGERKKDTDVAYSVLALRPARSAVELHPQLRDVLFYAHRDEITIASSSEADMRKLLAASKPVPPELRKKQPIPPSAFVKAEGFLMLGGEPGPANIRAYLDVPALAIAVRMAKARENARRQREWCFHRVRNIQECIGAYGRKEGRPPESLETLKAWVNTARKDRKLRGNVRTWSYNLKSAYCPTSRQAYAYRDGKIFCPVHGNLEKPLAVQAVPNPPNREEQVGLAAFGRMRLELWVDAGTLRLRLAQISLKAQMQAPLPRPEHGQQPGNNEEAEEVF